MEGYIFDWQLKTEKDSREYRVMSKIAILYICVGKYTVFWKDFYKSFEEKFIPDSVKEYFVFTDCKDIYDSQNERVHLIEQENLGWPGNTLFRFRMFLTQREKLKEFDYVFFMNANVQCVDYVGEEFLPIRESLLFVQHPGFYSAPNYRFPYDRNKKSSAYIRYGEGDVYVCGGINGGKSKAFLEMCEVLNQRIEADYGKGIIALWHDESQVNRYILENNDYKLLTPSYCYPEGSDIPFKPVLLVRDKSRYIDVARIKNVKSIKVIIKSLKEGIIYRMFYLKDRMKKGKR